MWWSPVHTRYAYPVSDVLDLLANGLSFEEILEELPDLEYQDILACLRLANRRFDHPVLAA